MACLMQLVVEHVDLFPFMMQCCSDARLNNCCGTCCAISDHLVVTKKLCLSNESCPDSWQHCNSKLSFRGRLSPNHGCQLRRPCTRVRLGDNKIGDNHGTGPTKDTLGRPLCPLRGLLREEVCCVLNGQHHATTHLAPPEHLAAFEGRAKTKLQYCSALMAI